MASIVSKMNPFKSRRGQYKAVSQDESQEPLTSPDEEQQAVDGSAPVKSAEEELEALRVKIRSLRTSLVMTIVALVITLIFFTLYAQTSNGAGRYLQLEWSGLLGEDSNGFVPNGKTLLQNTEVLQNTEEGREDLKGTDERRRHRPASETDLLWT